MHIVRVKIHNFGVFRGMHEVQLAAHVYAVVAVHDADPDRSNWLGKTTFLHAIRFCLYGKHPWDGGADAWITNGENSGGVEIETSDGAVVTRSKKRGISAQIRYVPPGADAPAAQASAQGEIDTALGMDHAEFLEGPFIQQKAISRLVTALPAQRTETINGWLDLGPVKDACDYSSDKLSAAVADDRALEQRLMGIDAALPARSEHDDEPDVEELETRLEALDATRAGHLETLRASDVHHMHSETATEFAGTKKSGQVLGAELKAAVLPDVEACQQAKDDARELYRAAKAAWIESDQLATDGFDGQCPIMCAECPATDHVTTQLAESASNIGALEHEVDAAAQVYDAASTKATESETEHRAHADKVTQLETLRATGRTQLASVKYITEHGAPPDDTAVEAQLTKCEAERDTLVADIARLKAGIAARARMLTEQQNIKAKRAALADSIRTWREATALLGRGGLQREIAEECMGEIETRANAVIAGAGIDLSIQVKWAREGSGLATNCSACGSPFPKGRGVKECTTCGVKRGPKMVEKTYFAISNRSGAADDIAGLAFQIAATTWKRSARGVLWSCVMIDEPFGACDPANARAMGTHLHTMIRHDNGFEQGFVVAHDAKIMEAMPARIVVRSDGTHARIEVQ